LLFLFLSIRNVKISYMQKDIGRRPTPAEQKTLTLIVKTDDRVKKNT